MPEITPGTTDVLYREQDSWGANQMDSQPPAGENTKPDHVTP